MFLIEKRSADAKYLITDLDAQYVITDSMFISTEAAFTDVLLNVCY